MAEHLGRLFPAAGSQLLAPLFKLAFLFVSAYLVRLHRTLTALGVIATVKSQFFCELNNGFINRPEINYGPLAIWALLIFRKLDLEALEAKEASLAFRALLGVAARGDDLLAEVANEGV